MKKSLRKNINFVIVFTILFLLLIKLIVTPLNKYLEFAVFNPESFIKSVEAKTFDLRQNIISKDKR